MEIQRILYPVEFRTDHHAALEAAAGLARAFDAELLLAHAVAFPYPYLDEMALGMDLDAYYRSMEEVVEDKLATLAAQAGDVTTATEVLRGDPASAILEAVERDNVDLVVMPTHARTGFERFLVGSVTERVVRLCEVPVLTIPPSERHRGPLAVDRILVPTDFSARSDRALSPAIELAQLFGADVLMLHVVTIGDADPANPDWGFPAIPEDHLDTALRVAEKALAERAPVSDGKVQVATELVRGFDAAEEIVRIAAEQEVDLVVMATHGHTGLAHALLGSTTGKVVRRLDRPILTIRSR